MRPLACCFVVAASLTAAACSPPFNDPCPEGTSPGPQNSCIKTVHDAGGASGVGGGSGGKAGVAGAAGGSGVAGTAGAAGMGAKGGAGPSGGAAGSAGAGGAPTGKGGAAGLGGMAGPGGMAGGSGAAGKGGSGGGSCAGAPTSGGTAKLGDPCSAAGATTCAGHAQAGVLTCNAATCTWTTKSPCTGGSLCDSTDATCKAPVNACLGKQPGATLCDGSTRIQCGPDLVSASMATCKDAAHCAAGTADKCGVCVDGEHSCDGVSLKKCALDHQSFVLQETCATAALCNPVAGACTSSACLADQYTCNGDTLQKCNAAMDGFDVVQTCAAGLCDAAAKACDACAQGTTTCADATNQAQCSSDGKTLTTVACAAGTPYCVGSGACVQCADATPCPATGNECVVPNCASGTCGTGPAPVGTSCGAGGVCNGNGVCGVCEPGKTQCKGSGLQTCDATGQWMDSTCPDDKPICSGTTCSLSAVSVATGSGHACALISDGTVRCWGTNITGQLGNGSIGGATLVPTTVPGLADVLQVSAGTYAACVRGADGVRCWGRYGVGPAISTPTLVPGTSGAVEVSAAGYGALYALFPDGSVSTWPASAVTGTVADPPSAIAGVTDAAHLAAGYGGPCVLTNAATVVCWGPNNYGQLGLGAKDGSQHAPTVVPGLSNVVEVSCGGGHVCARTSTDAAPWCWGDSAYGQTGTGTIGTAIPPTKLTGTSVLSLAAGAGATCARAPGGTLCWGDNVDGAVGVGLSGGHYPTPQTVALSDSTAIAAGGSGGHPYFCAIRSGTVVCWGYNGSGQLGVGDKVNRSAPTPVVWLVTLVSEREPPGRGAASYADCRWRRLGLSLLPRSPSSRRASPRAPRLRPPRGRHRRRPRPLPPRLPPSIAAPTSPSAPRTTPTTPTISSSIAPSTSPPTTRERTSPTGCPGPSTLAISAPRAATITSTPTTVCPPASTA
jgi:alpha-tubulin suppressor-like RCC1 family protein